MLEVYLVELRPNLMMMMLTQALTIDPFDVSGYLNANNLTISHDVDNKKNKSNSRTNFTIFFLTIKMIYYHWDTIKVMLVIVLIKMMLY